MMRKIILLSTAAILFGCDGGPDAGNAGADASSQNVAESATQSPPAANAASGQQYAMLAGASDLYEIEAARLAADQAERADVKELARMILADHQRSTETLATAARQSSPPLTIAPELDAEKRANLDALRAASGAAFDAEYLRQQVTAHEQALAMVEGYARDGDVAQLREHAATVSGPIRQHLERARALAASPPPAGGGQ